MSWSVTILELFFNLLLFFTAAGYILPIIIGLAIRNYASNAHTIPFDDIKKLSLLCLIFSLCGVPGAFAEPVILYAHFSLQGFNPRLPGFLEGGMLAYTIGALCHSIGIMLLIALRAKLPSLPGKKHCKKILHSLYILLTLIFFTFFISIIIKSFPFSNYPIGVSRAYLLSLLIQQTIHHIILSFVPGGICALLFCVFSFKHNRFFQGNNKINVQIKIVRCCCLCCAIGLVPKTIIALANLARSFLYGGTVQPQSIIFENYFLIASFLSFIVLLLPRFSLSRLMQSIATFVFLIVWNWRSFFSTAQNLMTK